MRRPPRWSGRGPRRSGKGGGSRGTAGTTPRVVTGRPEKHSLTLNGHRTSVSLEPEFWREFRAIAAGAGRPINDLAAEIDAGRGTDRGLASAIRVYVLDHAIARGDRAG